jgi:hypothetical protein
VIPPLLDHGIGTLAHLRDDPVAGLARRLGPRHARAEVELRLHVAARRFAVEGVGRWGRRAIARA